MQLFAGSYLPVSDGKIPTGEIRSVSGTPLEFHQPRAVRAPEKFDYDRCWVLDRSTPADNLSLAARLSEPRDGRVLEISTNQPGIQFHDGHFLDGLITGRAGHRCGPLAGLCLEPEKFPDAPNHYPPNRTPSVFRRGSGGCCVFLVAGGDRNHAGGSDR